MLISNYLKPIIDNWEWQFQGACNGVDTNDFYLDEKMRNPSKGRREQAAIAICNTCPVKAKCLEHALSVPEFYGVWGGSTEEQRLAIINSSESKFGYTRT